ncbi:MAG: hypothetical protein RLZZ299_480 [Pseudomonadota bacterium]|jgi:hypothetical protein
MRFRIAHTFPCPAATYWDVSNRPEVEAALAAAAEVTTEALGTEVRGDTRVSRTRVRPNRPLPPLVQKALGAERFSYVQESVHDDSRRATRWSVLPDVLGERITCGGTAQVRDLPDGRCERVIEGEIQVRVTLVGGAIEKAVVEELERSYGRGAEVLTRHVRVG